MLSTVAIQIARISRGTGGGDPPGSCAWAYELVATALTAIRETRSILLSNDIHVLAKCVGPAASEMAKESPEPFAEPVAPPPHLRGAPATLAARSPSYHRSNLRPRNN